MKNIQAGIPKGMRDFGPQEMARRNYIIKTLRELFERFAFQELQTPAMEKLETLTGKYGEEGDKLIFKVLNNGDFLKKVNPEVLESRNSTLLARYIAEKGLRYDLTIPFARYVAMNRNDIAFPFRRYQIQPVWRADRPQKGRYREFVQCDVDVIGSAGLVSEAELIQIYQMAFSALNIDVSIRLNHRKILEGLAEELKAPTQFNALTVALDKLDKMGMERLKPELAERGLIPDAILRLEEIINQGKWTLDELERMIPNEKGREGVDELNKVLSFLSPEEKQKVKIDITLARGLDYYTGTIFEVTAEGVNIGSVGGGGRYADLTGVFGLPGMSGVGVSFGLDRIYDVMEELNLFPGEIEGSSQIFFVNFGEKSEKAAFDLMTRFRLLGFSCELYPEAAKLKKQMKYANAKGIPFVLIMGEEELADGKILLKNMESGQEELLTEDEAVEKIKTQFQ